MVYILLPLSLGLSRAAKHAPFQDLTPHPTISPTGHGQAAHASAEKGPVEAESWTLAEARGQSFAHLPAWQVEGSDAEEGNEQNMPEQPPHLQVCLVGEGPERPIRSTSPFQAPLDAGVGAG